MERNLNYKYGIQLVKRDSETSQKHIIKEHKEYLNNYIKVILAYSVTDR